MRIAIFINHKRIQGRTTHWHVSGVLAQGCFLMDELHGDITKLEELAVALREFFESKPRYFKHMEPDHARVRH